jgi:hypothetical protein
VKERKREILYFDMLLIKHFIKAVLPWMVTNLFIELKEREAVLFREKESS